MRSSDYNKQVVVAPEGWFVIDPRSFRWFYDNPPPRVNAYFHQLSVDARSWKPIALWVFVAGFLTLAAITGE
jgi:hypothetical protein